MEGDRERELMERVQSLESKVKDLETANEFLISKTRENGEPVDVVKKMIGILESTKLKMVITRETPDPTVVTEIPEENPDYTFSPEDVRALQDRVLYSEDVSYRSDPPSTRHRGLTPMMTSVLSMIHRASGIARRRNQSFRGLSLHDLQSAFTACGISNDTVRDTLRRLAQLRGLDVIRSVDGRVRRYLINQDTIPVCFNGGIVFNETSDENLNLLVIQCPAYPFCTCQPRDCSAPEALNGVLSSEYIEMLRSRVQQRIRDNEEIAGFRRDLESFIGADHHDRLTPSERDTIAEMFFLARRLYGESEFEENRDGIVERIKGFIDDNFGS